MKNKINANEYENIIINMTQKIGQLQKYSILKKDEIDTEYTTTMIDYLTTSLIAITVLVSVS